jgi:hypothetical protein
MIQDVLFSFWQFLITLKIDAKDRIIAVMLNYDVTNLNTTGGVVNGS